MSFVHGNTTYDGACLRRLEGLPRELTLHILSYVSAVDLADICVFFKSSESLRVLDDETTLWKRHVTPPDDEPAVELDILPPQGLLPWAYHIPTSSLGREAIQPCRRAWYTLWSKVEPPQRAIIRNKNLDVNLASNIDLNYLRDLCSIHAAPLEPDSWIFESCDDAVYVFARAKEAYEYFGRSFPLQYPRKYCLGLLQMAYSYINSKESFRADRIIQIDATKLIHELNYPFPKDSAEKFVNECCDLLTARAETCALREDIVDLEFAWSALTALSRLADCSISPERSAALARALSARARTKEDQTFALLLHALAEAVTAGPDRRPYFIRPPVPRVQASDVAFITLDCTAGYMCLAKKTILVFPAEHLRASAG